MKKLTLVLLVITAACAPKTDQSADPDIARFENNLVPIVSFEGDAAWNIEERMKHYGVPGVSIAVIKDNKVIWSKAYGIMDKETNEPVTTKTLFQAGSISKPVAAYVALKNVELGKVTLTDDVNTWLKTWKVPENEFTKEKKVTLEQLLSHTGGLTVHGFLGYSPDLPVPTLVQVLDGAPPANSPPIRVDKVPGGTFRYSGGGYSVMQQLVIDVNDNKTFPAIAKELVLGPLGMDNSTYDQPLDPEKLKLAATGYLPNHEQTKGKRHTYPEMAAAGLWTTAEDLAQFAIDVQRAVKGESKIVSKQMAERMLTAIDEGYGLGLGIDTRKGETYFGHGGWDEGFSSDMKAHRDKGYGIVVLTNSNHPPFISEVIRAVAKTYDWANRNPEYRKLPMDTTLFKDIRGRYRNGSDGRIFITTEGDKLFFKYIREDDRRELFRISDTTYITGTVNAPLNFKTLPDGTIDLVIYEDGSQRGSHPKVKDDEIVPYEHLLAGDFNKALKGYQALMKTNDDSANEQNLADQGFNQVESGNGKLAKDIFKIVTNLYPNSSNAFHGYGDVCRELGDKDEALASYKKALKLDPNNEALKKTIADLENIPK